MDFGGLWQVALVDDPERVQPCDADVELGQHAHSAHVLSRTRRDRVRHALRLNGSGGVSAVHARSLLLEGDRALVAVGAWLCAVDLPSLKLEWSTEVDWATCFGVYALDGEYLSHGELSIARVGRDGKIRWEASGRDIFTGKLVISADAVTISDFYENRYRIDAATGHIEDLQ
jgi:hypothetical protein